MVTSNNNAMISQKNVVIIFLLVIFLAGCAEKLYDKDQLLFGGYVKISVESEPSGGKVYVLPASEWVKHNYVNQDIGANLDKFDKAYTLSPAELDVREKRYIIVIVKDGYKPCLMNVRVDLTNNNAFKCKLERDSYR